MHKDLKKNRHNCDNIGIRNGIMCEIIYNAYIWKKTRNNDNLNKIEKLLAIASNNISEHTPLDLKDGLTGFILGLRYLIKDKIIDGDKNLVTEDLNNYIYLRISFLRHWINTDETFKTISARLIDILIYLLFRIDDFDDDDEHWICENFIIKTMNEIYQERATSFFQEKIPASIDAPLPLYLWCLGKIYNYGIEKERVQNLLKEIGYEVFSLFPQFHYNRLVLLYAISQFCTEIQQEQWSNYAQILYNNISIEKILFKELQDKRIYFLNGVAGVYLLLLALNKENKFSFKISHQMFYNRIIKSEVWTHSKNNNDCHEGLDGLRGLEILLDYMKIKHNCKHENPN